MSTGTALVERALEKIGAHSIVSPASPESIDLGFETLGSMLEMWETRGIMLGVTPIGVVGDEVNEPADARNGIISNLALELAPYFDNGRDIVSQALIQSAKSGFSDIKNLYQVITIPDKVVSSTLPAGAGNRRGLSRRAFFPKGGTVSG